MKLAIIKTLFEVFSYQVDLVVMEVNKWKCWKQDYIRRCLHNGMFSYISVY